MVQLIVGVNHKAPNAIPAEKPRLGDDVRVLRLSHSWDQLLFRPKSLMQTRGPNKALGCTQAAQQLCKSTA